MILNGKYKQHVTDENVNRQEELRLKRNIGDEKYCKRNKDHH